MIKSEILVIQNSKKNFKYILNYNKDTYIKCEPFMCFPWNQFFYSMNSELIWDCENATLFLKERLIEERIKKEVLSFSLRYRTIYMTAVTPDS